MKHLYIIGNGFDIFTGLHTRYIDFRHWLKHNYAFIYENMSAAYEMEGEWWNDFEVQLGNLDVKRFVSKFTPPKMSMEEIMEKIEERKTFEQKYNLPPSLHPETPCAERLRGLLDILQYCFEKWVFHCQRTIANPHYTHIEIDNSYFINFNYTDVLQWLYKIPEDRVLHIHGRALKHERLIFGHNRHLVEGMFHSHDYNKTCHELSLYHKNPYVHIFKHEQLPTILKNVEFVYIYGLSLSPVDEGYLDWIVNNTPKNCKWEISWHTDIDKQRINEFILNHKTLKERVNFVKLKQKNIVKLERNYM